MLAREPAMIFALNNAWDSYWRINGKYEDGSRAAIGTARLAKFYYMRGADVLLKYEAEHGHCRDMTKISILREDDHWISVRHFVAGADAAMFCLDNGASRDFLEGEIAGFYLGVEDYAPRPRDGKREPTR
jgi:hypothetical protein